MPPTAIRAMIIIVSQCWPMTAGSTIMPTETKKMAPKRFLIPVRRCSMRSPSTVSARMEPMTKAPRADEKPANEASATMPKQRPMAMMSSISSFRKRFAFLRRSGMT